MLSPQARGLTDPVSVGWGLRPHLSFGCESGGLSGPVPAFRSGLWTPKESWSLATTLPQGGA